MEVKFGSGSDPSAGTRTLSYRLQAMGLGTHFDVFLLQGSTAVQSWAHKVLPADGVVQFDKEISGTITDYTDLRLRVIASEDDMPYAVYLKRDFGAVGNGTADDTTAVQNFVNAITPGITGYVERGIYKLTDEIVITGSEVVIVGLGHTAIGPSSESDTTGAIFRQTTASKWCFIYRSATNVNDFKGGRFENISMRDYTGGPTAAGGLLIQKGYCVVRNYVASYFGHTNGVGFKVLAPSSGDSAPLNVFENCRANDCKTGFYVDGTNGAAYATFWHCISSKFTVGGIKNTGYGIRINADGCAIHGGHCESHDVGLWIDALHGCGVYGMTFEDNTSYDIDLNRPSGVDGSRNLLIVRTTKIRVNTFQVKDEIVGGNNISITDLGTTTQKYLNT
jgi:hypothetical protein